MSSRFFFCFFSPLGLTKATVYDILIIDREENPTGHPLNMDSFPRA
nr:MAG TPA: hypothetical protein [Caudoviricetes sp.]